MKNQDKRMQPELRFGGFSGDWEYKLFKKILKLDRGCSPRPIIKFITTNDDGVSWIKIGDTKGEAAFINFTKEKITKEGAEKSRKVVKGEIILSNSMSYGKPYILNINGFIHDGWFVIRHYQQNLDRDYLIQLLGSELVQRQYKRLAAGGVVTNISSELVYSVKVKLPLLQEQTKIANFLSTVDDKITNTEKQLDLFKDYKKGMMQRVFSQEIRFKDDDGKTFPDWVEKKLGDVSSITTGNSNREDSNLNGEYAFFDRSEDIRLSNIYLFDSEAVIVAGEGKQFIPKYFIGKFDLHQRTYAIMNFNNAVGKYIYFMINKNQNYFSSQAVGSTVKSLRLPMFQKMPILLPFLQEQTKIANFLSAIDEKIEMIDKLLTQLKLFKKSLLQRMFV